jgi:hypothetical protein
MEAIRKANINIAIALIGLGIIWLTPVLNTERISASTQVSRVEKNPVLLAQLDMWALDREWGKAGARAIKRLILVAEKDGFAADLTTSLARLSQANSRYEFGADVSTQRDGDIDAIGDFITVLQGSDADKSNFLTVLKPHQSGQIAQGCRQMLASGRHGCVLVMGEFGVNANQRSGFLIHLNDNKSNLVYWEYVPGDGENGFVDWRQLQEQTDQSKSASEMLGNILAGGFSIQPSPFNVLKVGDGFLSPSQ